MENRSNNCKNQSQNKSTNQTNDQSIESYGIGISNLKQRYRLEGEAEPEFVARQDAFEVRLPIIKRKQ
jgi:predicted HTH transcriptional regulator